MNDAHGPCGFSDLLRGSDLPKDRKLLWMDVGFSGPQLLLHTLGQSICDPGANAFCPSLNPPSLLKEFLASSYVASDLTLKLTYGCLLCCSNFP